MKKKRKESCFKNCGDNCQAKNAQCRSLGYSTGKASVGAWVQIQSAAACFLLQGRSVLSYLKPSSDWMRSVHTMENNRLCSKSTDLNINHI